MEKLLHEFINSLSLPLLLVVIVISLIVLSKGADIFVDQAVALSIRWRVPKMIIGTTIVSIGTTLPEAAVSVMAAIKGNPDLALGNAIGSIIVDTGLIIGIAALIGILVIDRKTIKRQGRIQLFSGFLLAFFCLPFMSRGSGGNISQLTGIFFLLLLCAYIFTSIRWAQKSNFTPVDVDAKNKPIGLQFVLFAAGAALVVAGSRILIPAVEVTAIRIGVPQGIIAATLVALGTSLPELVTAVTAVRKGHGELAIGNIVGADILNVLFVVGASAAVTRGGLNVPVEFFRLQIPTMLLVLAIFRFYTRSKYEIVTKKAGIILLAVYIVYILISYLG